MWDSPYSHASDISEFFYIHPLGVISPSHKYFPFADSQHLYLWHKRGPLTPYSRTQLSQVDFKTKTVTTRAPTRHWWGTMDN